MVEPITIEWPAALTSDLREILGMMCFELGPIAHAYRIGGHQIAHKAEDEQAFMLHRMIRAWAQHGPLWRDVIGDELDAIVAAGSPDGARG